MSVALPVPARTGVDAPLGLVETARRALIVLSIAGAVAYLVWRALFTYHPEYVVYSLLFLAADCLGFVTFITFAITLWDLRPRSPAPPPPPGWRVDVWIPTYNEPEDVLRRTIYHCVHMEYPHTTWVLDDGHRPWVQQLCEELGARYLSRPDNLHAKAGNLNHALAHTDGELIATFDADFVPARNFLTRLLGHFRDERVALVQAPQHYYNIDSFQHRFEPRTGRLWTAQDLFFDAVMPGKDNLGAAYWIGTCAILRRRAIEQIGGFPTRSVVEDMLTSIELHAHGWRSVYVNEPLAFGIAPAYLAQFLSQRLRWTQGVMQIVRSPSNPLVRRGLTWQQRVSYLNSILHFFDALPRLVYYAIPGVYLLSGATPVFLKAATLKMMLLYLGLHLLAVKAISKGEVRIWRNEVYALVHFLTYLKGNLALLTGRQLPFRVTEKRGRQRLSLRLLAGPLLVLGLSLAGLLYALVPAMSTGGRELFPIAIAGAFAGFYVLVGLAALRLCLSRPLHQESYYFHGGVPAELVEEDARHGGPPAATPAGSAELTMVGAMNERELLMMTSRPLPPHQLLRLRIRLPARAVSARAVVTGCADLRTRDGLELYEVHAAITDLDPEGERLLLDHFFQTAVPRLFRRLARRVPLALWRRWLGTRRGARRYTLHMPVAYRAGEQTAPRVAMLEDLSRTGLCMTAAESLPPGTAVCVSFAGIRDLRARVVRCETWPEENTATIAVRFDFPVVLPRRLLRAAEHHRTRLLRRRGPLSG
ncbi:MAG: hypothetical protein KatS3mg102_1898 [Planctomycetota bacterium]|nr:MAG: hypothetical protein KatS3mg102_1898 [Planctomycetota bacterium]